MNQRPPSPIEPGQLDAWMSTITIRLATASDTRGLLNLATIDSAAPLRGATLLAEQDGRLLAARSLEDGATISDPFARTAHLRALLATHARAHVRAPASWQRRGNALRPLAARG
jgi:hypothetical protein